MLVFVLCPAFVLAYGVRYKNITITRWAAFIAVIGVVLNRINTSVIAFNWNAAERYSPHWMEVTITVGIITMEVLAFRWIVNRMAILYDHPEYESSH
jgi:Ni/Fe-hydrogenase subunit HybB-like protein